MIKTEKDDSRSMYMIRVTVWDGKKSMESPVVVQIDKEGKMYQASTGKRIIVRDSINFKGMIVFDRFLDSMALLCMMDKKTIMDEIPYLHITPNEAT